MGIGGSCGSKFCSGDGVNENRLGLSWGRGKNESAGGGLPIKVVDEEKAGVDIWI